MATVNRATTLLTIAFAVAACSGPNYTGPYGCVDLWNEAVTSGSVIGSEEAADATMTYQRYWEGDTPMCWLGITASGACHRFQFDVEGTWGPAEWIRGEVIPGKCISETPDRFTASLLVTAKGTLIEP